MQRISTPTREVDKFGPGKDGFKGGGPPDATQLEPPWFDNVQEELANVVEGQGEILDGLNLQQVKEAIDDYAFVDPSITGTLTIENGATLDVLAGGTLETDVGSSANINGDMIVGGLGSFTCNGPADFMNDVTLGDLPGDVITVNGTMVCFAIVNLQAGAFLGSQEIEGGAGSVVDVETVQVSSLELDDTGPSPLGGHLRFVDTVYMAGHNENVTYAMSIPIRGWDESIGPFPNFINDTTASATRRIQFNEPVWIKISFSYELTAIGTGNLWIEITGPLGTVNADISQFRADTANQPYTSVREFLWTPTDDFPLENATQAYVILVRLGTNAGNITAENIGLETTSALKVP